MGLAGTQRLYLSEPDIDIVTTMYTDPNDEQRVIHTTFTDDIDHGLSSSWGFWVELRRYGVG